jgi:hypothetical protein
MINIINFLFIILIIYSNQNKYISNQQYSYKSKCEPNSLYSIRYEEQVRCQYYDNGGEPGLYISRFCNSTSSFLMDCGDDRTCSRCRVWNEYKNKNCTNGAISYILEKDVLLLYQENIVF